MSPLGVMQVGQTMAELPLDPQLAKMVVASPQYRLRSRSPLPQTCKRCHEYISSCIASCICCASASGLTMHVLRSRPGRVSNAVAVHQAASQHGACMCTWCCPGVCHVSQCMRTVRAYAHCACMAPDGHAHALGHHDTGRACGEPALAWHGMRVHGWGGCVDVGAPTRSCP